MLKFFVNNYFYGEACAIMRSMRVFGLRNGNFKNFRPKNQFLTAVAKAARILPKEVGMRSPIYLKHKVSSLLLVIVATFGAYSWIATATSAGPMPVKDPAQEGLKPTNVGIRNLIDIGQIYAAVKDGETRVCFWTWPGYHPVRWDAD